jgi:hypothetical protein
MVSHYAPNPAGEMPRMRAHRRGQESDKKVHAGAHSAEKKELKKRCGKCVKTSLKTRGLAVKSLWCFAPLVAVTSVF